MATSFYEILGLPRTASHKEIQAAYKRLARKYHPDVTGGDKEAEEHFKKVNEANEVLSDEETRAAYDKWGDQWPHAEQLEQMQRQRGGPGGGFPGGRGPGDGFRQGPGGVRFEFGSEGGFGDDPGGGFGSIFERLFRGEPETAPHARPQTQRGHDIEHDVRISLAEAFAGTTRRVQVQSIEDGEPIGKQLEVTIPAGVESGSKVRLRGKGGPGIGGGPPGDVVLVVEVAIDPLFERKGNSLRTDIPLPLTVAMLGGEAEVGTLDGSVVLNIPPGTQNGRVFRLGGKGMPLLNASEDQRGDLFARVRVVLPVDLSDEERELVRRLHDLRHGHVRDAGSASHDDPSGGAASGDNHRNDSPTPEGGDS